MQQRIVLRVATASEKKIQLIENRRQAECVEGQKKIELLESHWKIQVTEQEKKIEDLQNKLQEKVGL